MNIIKRGTRREDKEYRATCDACGTIFELKASEARFIPDSRDGNYYEIECPVCNTLVTIAQDLFKTKSRSPQGHFVDMDDAANARR